MKKRIVTFMLFVVVALFACASTVAFAIPIEAPRTGAWAEVYPGIMSPLGIIFDFNESFVGPSSASASLDTSFDGSRYDGNVSAESDFGVLSAFASVELTDYPAGSYWEQNSGLHPRHPAIVHSDFSDRLTFSGGSGVAYAALGFSVDGSTSLSTSLSATPPARASGQLIVSDENSSELAEERFYGPGELTAQLQFTYGVPVAFYAHLLLTVRAPMDLNATSPYDLFGIADFDSTVTLSQINVYADEQMTIPTSNFTFSAESGTQYPLSSVPEPSTLLLLGTGVLGLFGYTRRKR